MTNWILSNIFICVTLFFIGCFMFYLCGRLVSAGWYRSKRDLLGYENNFNTKGGGGGRDERKKKKEG